MPLDNVFKVAQILPGEAGLQRFEMGNSFSDGGAEPKRGQLLAYDNGEPRVVWETVFFTNTWDPNVLVVDVDVDGQPDIVVATHYRILVFDGATGETKMQLQYHGYRNYGWFGAANIDDDPYPEFGIVADFSMHAEVIDNDGTELTLRWLRDIQPDPAQSTKVVRPKPQALVDVDGDGRFELVYSIYNDQGDGHWHIVGVDALSGETSFDFPQHHLHGMADVDSDGRLELFVSATTGEALPTYAPLAVWSLEAGDGERALEPRAGALQYGTAESVALDGEHRSRRWFAHGVNRRRGWRWTARFLRSCTGWGRRSAGRFGQRQRGTHRTAVVGERASRDGLGDGRGGGRWGTLAVSEGEWAP